MRLDTSRDEKILNLTCVVEGIPGTYKLENTFVHIRYTDKIRYITGTFVSPNKLSYTIINYSYEAEGTYDCAIWHTIPGKGHSFHEITSALVFFESK